MKPVSDVETDLIGEKVFWENVFPAARDMYRGVVRGVVVSERGVQLIVELTKKETRWSITRIEDHTPETRRLKVVDCESVSLEDVNDEKSAAE
jgi:hypothetical protein